LQIEILNDIFCIYTNAIQHDLKSRVAVSCQRFDLIWSINCSM